MGSLKTSGCAPVLLTAEEMRAVERAAIDSGEVSGGVLMERAGRGVADAIAARWEPGRAVALCGPGNNGGDGYVVARLLAERGWDVACFAFGPGDLPPDAAAARAAWSGDCGAWADAGECVRSADLVVDAVFGAGLKRAVSEEVVAVFRGARAAIVAIDAPTGLCMDSGRPLGGRAMHAALTVTFHAPRLGHYLAEGPAYCGEVVCVDIGLAPGDTGVPLIEGPLFALGKAAGHKYDSGHALILAGEAGRGGAARMAARGALRAGAGLVTVACPPTAMTEHAARLDAIMLRPMSDMHALNAILEDARFNAVGLGPGLGVGVRTQGLVKTTLAARRSTVLDADAVTSFVTAPDALFGAIHRKCLLTPHDGEFARFFPDIAEGLTGRPEAGPAVSRLDAVRKAAARTGCVVLLKGPDTVIAGPDGRAAIHAAVYDRAAPWLATAGAGDVLTGIATGLMARGAAVFEAAATAAWLHVEAALEFGPGLVAEDLPEALPAVYRRLGL